MKKYVFWALALLFYLPLPIEHIAYWRLLPARAPNKADPSWVFVQQCTDGDTCRVRDLRGIEFIVRIEGIDAPEKEQCGGEEATKALRRLAQGRWLVWQESGFGYWGRHLGDFKLEGGRSIGELMIENAWAWPTKGLVDLEHFRNRLWSRGIWAKACAHMEPRLFRRKSRLATSKKNKARR